MNLAKRIIPCQEFSKYALTQFALFTCLFATDAWAQEERVIPPSSVTQGALFSTTLLVHPCLDSWPGADADTLKVMADARSKLPSGACDNPALAEKIFKARFLQYATLALVDEPWELHAKITRQNQAIDHCRDTRCLEQELDTVIAALTPVYLHPPNQAWPGVAALCNAESDVTLTKKTRKEIADECAPDAASFSACTGSHGKLAFAICGMQGNQVNATAWLYRKEKNGEALLLSTSDGPFAALPTTCNGMPDLVTGARVNAGEHRYTWYRYDGGGYQMFYGYTGMFLDSIAGHDFSIAQDAGVIQNTVTCR
ncbi:MAG: hypothetical protein LBE24_01290 [Methylobacillus sp.]|jgi:hypothetical protein|nr:hypothetical protein [Methylobacillus sp.]